MIKRFLQGLGACIAFSAAFAVTAQAAECTPAQGATETRACAAEELNSADQQLNALYLQYRSSITATVRQNQLRDVQLAWIKYRDLSCKFEASGASDPAAVRESCLAELTRARTKELQDLMK